MAWSVTARREDIMNVIALSASPKMDKGNTALILNPFLDGMREAGAKVERKGSEQAPRAWFDLRDRQASSPRSWQDHFCPCRTKTKGANPAFRPIFAQEAQSLSQRSVEHPDRDFGQCTRHQHPLPPGAPRSIWQGRHPRNLWCDRVHVWPAAR